MASILGTVSLSFSLSLFLPPHPVFLSLIKTKKAAALLSNPMEKLRGRGMGVFGQQPAGPEAISPATLGELNSAEFFRVSLEADPSPTEHWGDIDLAMRLTEGCEGP